MTHRTFTPWVLALCVACSTPAPATPEASVPVTPVEASVPETPAVMHTVEEGQTLWDIATAYNVTVDSILEANDLRPRDVRRISKGRELRIVGASVRVVVPTAAERAAALDPANLPPLEDGAYHVLSTGETLWDVARLYDKSLDELMTRNELSDDDVSHLREGRAVIVPGITESQVRRASPADRPRAVGVSHTMRAGETVWDLAGIFQIGVSQIMAANSLSAAEVTALREGSRLFIPGATRDRASAPAPSERAAARPLSARARRLGLGTRAVASSLLRGRVTPAWLRALGGSRRFAGTLLWPIANGNYVRGFGSGEGGYHLATDIRGDIGWNVRAAAPGIVGYAGDEVPGYGNIVLVIHPGGWVTMYAHNSVNFVHAGDEVRRGAVLAEVGSTGISRGPHVHFEFMYDGKNCDPAPLFRPGIRHRNGRLAAIAPASWTTPGNRPSQIACHPRRRHPRSRWVVDEDPQADAEP